MLAELQIIECTTNMFEQAASTVMSVVYAQIGMVPLRLYVACVCVVINIILCCGFSVLFWRLWHFCKTFGSNSLDEQGIDYPILFVTLPWG